MVASHGRAVVVEDVAGTLWRCVTRRRAGRTVTGDRVRWEPSGTGEGVVEAVLPRRSLLARPEPDGRPRPLAANLDQVVIVMAPLPPWQPELLDRYLVVAEHHGLRPLLLLNKVDLPGAAGPGGRTALATYAGLGYPLLACSALDRQGLDELSALLRGHASILVGQSGVGKSSLVHRLVPGIQVATAAINAATGLGRHTTVATTLYRLPGGGAILDSPGTRDFDVWHIPAAGIATGFVEFRPYLGSCRFRDCRHLQEPGCAVQQAVAQGRVDGARLRSYQAMVRAAAP